MATLNISLSDAMRDYVEDEVATGRYVDSSDFFRDLIRGRQRQHEELLQLLAEAEASGLSERSFDEIVAGVREKFLSRVD